MVLPVPDANLETQHKGYLEQLTSQSSLSVSTSLKLSFIKQGRLGTVYLAVETSIPAKKKLPPTSPNASAAAPTSPSRRRFPTSKDPAEGWTGVFETEYME